MIIANRGATMETLNLNESAKLLNIRIDMLNRLLFHGKIICHKIGKVTMIKRDYLEYVRKNKMEAFEKEGFFKYFNYRVR